MSEAVPWFVSTAAVRPASVLATLLTPDEQARQAEYHRQADRDRFGTGRALARLTLADHLGRAPADVQFSARCRICGGPHGQLFLSHVPRIGVSISHAGDRVLFGLATDNAIGVDVEEMAATSFDGFTDIALAPGESARTPLERAQLWTRKEAVLKATGWGLAVEPSRLRLSAPGAPRPELLDWSAEQPRPEHVRVVDVGAPDGYAAAAAVLADTEDEPVTLDGDAVLDRWTGSLTAHRT